MVQIIRNEGNTVYYSCDCGAKGKCMIKPLGESDTLVMNIACALCGQVERVVLVQYETEEEREALINNLNEAELSWSLILSNEVIN